jgi:RNA polymerase sigma factor FliA
MSRAKSVKSTKSFSTVTATAPARSRSAVKVDSDPIAIKGSSAKAAPSKRLSLVQSSPASPAAAAGKLRQQAKQQTTRTGRPIAGPTGSPFDRMPAAEMWAEYKKTQSATIRNYVWEKHISLVKYIAEKIYTRLPDEVDIQDLVQAGQFGLMDAIDLFDPDKGFKFETYAATRIHGAMLDELRHMDWVPRLVRHRTAKVNAITDKFEMRHGRAPTQEEVAERLGVSGDELEKIIKDSGAVSTISLNRKCFNSDGNKEVTEIDVLKDESQRNPLQETQRRDIKELMTKGLSRAERLIITLYYYEEMTMKEIGQTLDLSESRVSQMHSSILARLKAQMQHRAEDTGEEEEETE